MGASYRVFTIVSKYSLLCTNINILFCFEGKCESNPCKNGGSCIGDGLCKCPPLYVGAQCEKARLGTRKNPAQNAQEILNAGDSLGSGLYWIQPEMIANANDC